MFRFYFTSISMHRYSAILNKPQAGAIAFLYLSPWQLIIMDEKIRKVYRECIPVRSALSPAQRVPHAPRESARKFRTTNWDRITPIYIYS